mmetsp:Transcript_8834/g.7813  ORF Transcript_8834/g.7813 Transcript_8834/m.7813 type:complete len:150 (+) Transcript_8834:14-463(+)
MEFDAADITKIEAGKLKPGSLVMINDKPCKVQKTTKAKPGKHGSAKAIVTAVGILDDKKVEQSFGTSDLLDAPIVVRTEYPLLGLEDDFLQLQEDSGELKENVTFSTQDSLKDVEVQIRKFIDDDIPALVTVMYCLGKEMPVSVREDKD